MNPTDFLTAGGGFSFAPTSGADSRVGSTSLNFGNSAGPSTNQLLVGGVVVLGALFIFSKAN